ENRHIAVATSSRTWMNCRMPNDLWALLVGSSSSCCFTIQKSFQEHMMMCQLGVENTGYTQV
ncbi:unnamed protein product, partial [Musa acuminata var. zebrina]